MSERQSPRQPARCPTVRSNELLGSTFRRPRCFRHLPDSTTLLGAPASKRHAARDVVTKVMVDLGKFIALFECCLTASLSGRPRCRCRGQTRPCYASRSVSNELLDGIRFGLARCVMKRRLERALPGLLFLPDKFHVVHARKAH